LAKSWTAKLFTWQLNGAIGSVAAVCDCRWKNASVLIERLYQRKPSVVAPFYDFRLEKNQFTKA
jgi:hypothetical protein